MFTEARRSLVDTLATGLDVPVHDVVPEPFSPPGVLVRPPISGTYAAAGQFPGELLVTMDLWLVVKKSQMFAEQEELDTMVESILAIGLEWSLQGIDGTRITTFPAGDFPVVIMHYAQQRKY